MFPRIELFGVRAVGLSIAGMAPERSVSAGSRPATEREAVVGVFHGQPPLDPGDLSFSDDLLLVWDHLYKPAARRRASPLPPVRPLHGAQADGGRSGEKDDESGSPGMTLNSAWRRRPTGRRRPWRKPKQRCRAKPDAGSGR